MTLPEIMAPVGSWESLRAAIDAGADSIYFGIEQLNMRARSSINFTKEDLKEIVSLCRDNGVKSYLTLNTILYNHDMRLMKSIIDSAKESGCDAIIAMDHAAIMYANEVNLPVHISTQANITNIESIKFYANFADVVVLSRELSISQIKDITTQIKKDNIVGKSGKLIRIECFVHGALCMAVSGKCYLSLHTANSSANRGACKQNCRRKYTVTDEEGNVLEIDNEFIMSPKDLNTIDILDKMVDAGISVLKIEGRSKGPDYVYETVSCYKEAVESIADNSFNQEKIDSWNSRLERVYNRGFWNGYYLGQEMGEWTDQAGSKATEKKVFIGKGIKYYPNSKVGAFKLMNDKINVGDKIMITGPTTGMFQCIVPELRIEDSNFETIESKGTEFSLPLDKKIRPSDKLYKIVSS